MDEKIVAGAQPRFASEMTIDKAYVRRSWKPYAKLRRSRWLIAVLPAVCLVYSAYVMLTMGDLPLGMPIMSGIFLLFALLLPSMAISHLFNSYRQFKADGLRRVTLLPDGVETALVKYGTTVFHGYESFLRVEEDGEFWYLVMANRQKVLIPKAPCLAGEAEGVAAWLEERIAACTAAAEAAEDEAEEDVYEIGEAEDAEN